MFELLRVLKKLTSPNKQQLSEQVKEFAMAHTYFESTDNIEQGDTFSYSYQLLQDTLAKVEEKFHIVEKRYITGSPTPHKNQFVIRTSVAFDDAQVILKPLVYYGTTVYVADGSKWLMYIPKLKRWDNLDYIPKKISDNCSDILIQV